jgi:hypothetical protein
MIIQLNARVSRVYIDLSSRALQHNDRHLVHFALSALQKKDTNYKVTWLSIAEPALGEGRSEAWRSRTRTAIIWFRECGGACSLGSGNRLFSVVYPSEIVYLIGCT